MRRFRFERAYPSGPDRSLVGSLFQRFGDDRSVWAIYEALDTDGRRLGMEPAITVENPTWSDYWTEVDPLPDPERIPPVEVVFDDLIEEDDGTSEEETEPAPEYTWATVDGGTRRGRVDNNRIVIRLRNAEEGGGI